jgi:hypothetical protein
MLGFAILGRRRTASVFCALVASVAMVSVSHAAEHRFSLLFDIDNVAATGCTVSTVNGPVSGIDRIATAVVSTTTTTATVARLEQQTCTGGTLSAATTYDAGGWSAGLGNGTGGSAAIEFSVPMTSLPRGATVKALATSRNALGQEDATSSFLFNISNAIAAVESVPVPLSHGLAALLAAIVAVTVALRFRRQNSSRLVTVLMAGVILSTLAWAATVVRDGNIADWAGVSAAVTDASGDAPTNADIRAVYQQQDDTNLYVRIDADVRLDAPTNLAPVVNTGANQTITLPAAATLAGTASDDGLPNPPATLTINWSKVSGLGTVTFANANAASTSATFGLAGSYVLRLTASDSALSTSRDVTVTVNPVATVNTAPVIANLPATALTTLPINTVSLPATVTDDGLPNPPATVSTIWSKVSGPGTVTFANAAAASTTAAFSAAGSYVLRLTASDSLLTATQDITVTVNPVATVNTAPVIANLPATALTTLPINTVSLPATVTDDGLPNPPATVSTLWSKVSGPGTVTFSNAAAANTTATFSAAGSYVLRLTASDSVLTATQDITVTVNPLVVGNTAPVISNLPAAQTITLPTNTLSFTPTVVDDGLPNPPAALTYAWSKVSGPSTPAAVPYALTFSATDTKNTTVTFDFGGVGAYVLRLTVSDGALTTSQDVAVTLLDAPPAAATFGAIPNKTVKVGDTLRFVLAANDPNYQQTLAYSLLSSPSGATLGGAGNALFSFTPSKSQVGNHPVTVQVADNTQPAPLIASKTFTITVVDANQPPAFTAPSKADGSVPAGATFTRALSATDPDAGDTLTYSLVSGPPGMTVSTAGALSWTSPSVVSVQTVTIKVTDSAGNFDVARFNVAVLPSAAPVAQDDAYRVQIGQTLNVNAAQGVLANDVDPAGLSLTATKQSDPTKGSLTSFNANGSFSYAAPGAPAANSFNPVLVKQQQILDDSTNHNWQLVDLNGDGHADIVFNHLCFAVRGCLTAFDIKNNVRLWTTDASADGCTIAVSGPSFNMAVGDIDDDGVPDVLIPGHCSVQNTGITRILAFNARNGALKWRSPSVHESAADAYQVTPLPAERMSLTIARLRSGEKPSVLIGRVTAGAVGANTPDGTYLPQCASIVASVSDGYYVYPSTTPHYLSCAGVIVLNGETGAITQRMIQDAGNGTSGSEALWRGQNGTGFIFPAMALDFDGSGQNKIMMNGAVWNLDGTKFGASKPIHTLAIALGNFDNTPDVEMALIEQTPSGVRLVLKKADGRVLWSLPLPTSNTGHITVADVDGDGKPDVVFNMAFAEREEIWAVDHRGRVRWIHKLPCPASVGCNGFTYFNRRVAVFDLDGDGVAEVIFPYANELRFLDGATGEVKGAVATLNAGSAAYEAVARVADVDNDGHADVVLVSSGSYNCGINPACFANVMVFSDAAKQWRPARKVDNQFAYFAANIGDDGTIPITVPLTNNFATARGNVFASQPQILTPVDPRLRDQTSFTYAASNGSLSSSPATVKVTIEPQNRPPKFTSIPPTRHNVTLSYQAVAIDPDQGDTLTYAIETQVTASGLPCTLVATTGLLTCTRLDTGAGLILISATDSFGAKALHTVAVEFSGTNCTVPNVIGQAQSAASTAITAAGCGVGDVSESYSPSIAAGQVISQSPSPTTVIVGGEAVSLLVSKGPTPVVVPLAVGRAETLAVNALTNIGFTAQVSRQFSNTVPFGIVISQSPTAGTSLAPTAANPVNIVVSAGSGLELGVEKSLLNAGQSTTLLPQATDVNGVPVGLPALTYAVEIKWLPARGSAPSISGTTFSTAADTMGVYTVTATDAANGRSASVDVAITLPRPADAKSNGAVFADLFQTLEHMDRIGQQLIAARAANDDALMRSLLTSYVTRWRQTDLARLKLAQPISLPVGFMPDEVRMRSFGFTPTPADILVQRILSDASRDLQARIAAQREPTTSLATLRALNQQFATSAARLNGLQISEIGGAISHPEIVQLLGHDIPEFYEAFTDDLAVVVGLPRRTTRYPGLKRADSGDHSKSTLAEQLVKIAVDEVIDEVKKRASETWANTKLFAAQTAQFAAWNAAAVATTAYLKKYLYMKDVAEVVSGASLSYRVFGSPFSFIEVESSTRRAPLYTTFVIGPTLIADVNAGFKEAIVKFQDAMSYGKTAVGNPNAVKNADDLFKIHDEFKEKVDAFFASAGATQKKFVERLYQSASEIEPGGCVFGVLVPCQQLTYPDGLQSVYEYSPPAGFTGIVGIPAAVIIMVMDNVTGEMFIKTVAFLPTPTP